MHTVHSNIQVQRRCIFRKIYSYKSLHIQRTFQHERTFLASHLFDRYILHRRKDSFPLSFGAGYWIINIIYSLSSDVQSPHDWRGTRVCKVWLSSVWKWSTESQVTKSAHVHLETFHVNKNQAMVITAWYQFFIARGNHARSILYRWRVQLAVHKPASFSILYRFLRPLEKKHELSVSFCS